MLQTKSTVLAQMGFTVGAMRHGVYQLRRFDGPNNEMSFDGVGLFLGRVPPAGTAEICLYVFNALGIRREPGVLNRLLETWGDLDARRLEESGIPGVLVDNTAQVFGAVREDGLVLERPTAGRQRHAALMESGDVVCYD